MKSTKRKERINNNNKKRIKVMKVLLRGYYFGGITKESNNEELNDLKDRSKRLRDHITNCSCPMCGNPRRYFKELKVQEIKALEYFKSQDF